MDARVDFDKYAAAVSRAHNVVCLPQGGLTAVPGTRFVKAAKSDANARLIDFEPVAEASYVIEAGATYLRFYTNQGRIVAAETDASITNGTFPTDLSSWTDTSTGGGSVAHDASKGAELVKTETGYSGLRQAVSVGASYQNDIHVLRFQIKGQPYSKATVRVGSSAGAADLALAESLGLGWHTVAFTPGAGTIYVEFRNKDNFDAFIDNVEFLSDEPLEITSPYSATEVHDIRTAQSSDVMYLFHADVPVQKLQRRGDAAWSLVEVFFEDGPWGGINPGVNLGAANLISNFDFESGFSDWEQGTTGTGFVDYDKEQQVVFLRRRAPTEPSGASDYDGTAFINHETVTPNSSGTHVIHFQIVGGGTIRFAVGTTSTAEDIVGAAFYGAGWHTVEFAPSASTFHVSFRGDQELDIIGGVGACYCYQAGSRLLKPGGRIGVNTLTVVDSAVEVFASTDVGRLLRLEWPGQEPGYAMITAVASATSATIETLRKLPIALATESWRLGAWCEVNGYPRAGTFFQQRLFAGRTEAQPQTIWASQGSANYESMRPDSWVAGANTVEADDAINVTLASKRISPINWMVGTRRLIVGTSSGNWAFDSEGAALSPIDIAAEQHTSIDCADMEAVQIDDVGVYVHRAKRAVYDIGFSYEIEGFRASDLTILAEHVTKSGIDQIVYQSEPFSLMWARLDDGTLAVMAYKRSQGVVGWTTVDVGGEVTSMAVIPGATAASGQVYDSLERDELWMVVKRTIDGSDVHYIEVMEGFFDGPNRSRYLAYADFQSDMKDDQVDAFHVNCGLTYQGASTTTLTGLDHLEGETVKVVVDGAVQSDKTVASGQITLDQAGLGDTMTAHVGLGYDWIIRGLKLPYGAQAGTGVAKTKTLNKLGLVLRDAATFQYGIEPDDDRDATLRPYAFRKASMAMGEAVPLFTGEVTIDLDGGYGTDPRILMKGTQPLPFTLLGIAPEQKTNERL